MDTKRLASVEVKDADKGQVSAVFATFDVIDKDGDVVQKSAFSDGTQVRISAYGHKTWEGALPVGKGVIRTTDNEAILEGQFFLGTSAGRDTFEVVKQMGDLQEWSWGFDVTDSEPGEKDGRKVRFIKGTSTHEVSPVLLGAGVGTRTLAVKADSAHTFLDEANEVMASVTALVDRAEDVMAKRREKGKGLGKESSETMADLKFQLERLAAVLTPEPEMTEDNTADVATSEFARFVAISSGLL